ncbi:DUF6069 family protein [Haladaptatus sp. SPP-AMP-3]|uniref:DUF6069 family protein n=1 Tax=Haladaptatus sp. SPP-AMP-3 TaxID=3121295 RepID=UPI003C3036ED
MPLLATATDAKSAPNVGVYRLATYGLFAAIVAMVVNSAILVVTIEALGVPAGFPLSWGPVLASSVVPAVGATVVYATVARVSRRPNRAFALVATLVLGLSFVPFVSPPPELSGAPQSVFVTLGAMHVAAAVAIVGLLSRVPQRTASAGESP